MTRVEADAWVADSAYQRTVYHATTAEAATVIRRHGFALGRRAGGRAWGNGVYAALDQDTLDHYLQQLDSRGIVLNLSVNVRSVLSVRVSLPFRRPPLEQILARLPDGFARLIDARLRTSDFPEAFTLVLTELGYDALEILEDRFSLAVGGNQIVVFSPERVVVIDVDPGGSRAPDG